MLDSIFKGGICLFLKQIFSDVRLDGPVIQVEFRVWFIVCIIYLRIQYQKRPCIEIHIIILKLLYPIGLNNKNDAE